MQVPILLRDFHPKNPADFEPMAIGQKAAVIGLVAPALDAQGKPTLAPGAAGTGYITSAATFAQWYRDVANVNHATSSKLTLWNNGAGAYVNRYGANGEPWVLTLKAYFCGNAGEERIDPATGAPIPCTFKFGPADCDRILADGGATLYQCIRPNGAVDGGPGVDAGTGAYTAIFQTGTVDGNPLFFPVDDQTDRTLSRGVRQIDAYSQRS